jgi:hypothetical protein
MHKGARKDWRSTPILKFKTLGKNRCCLTPAERTEAGGTCLCVEHCCCQRSALMQDLHYYLPNGVA